MLFADFQGSYEISPDNRRQLEKMTATLHAQVTAEAKRRAISQRIA